MKRQSIRFQAEFFKTQVISLAKSVTSSKELDDDVVKELIYSARQYINRHNKAKKLEAIKNKKWGSI